MLVSLAGCTVAVGDGDRVAVAPSTTARPLVTPETVPPLRVTMLFDGHAVEAGLVDGRAARDLAAMLPVTLDLTDTWGQAKSGPLTHPISTANSPRTLKPTAGGIYYWPETATLAVYYDDLCQTVPPPGLIQLGTLVDPTAISQVGRRTTVRMDWAAKNHS
ncbi:cyclophilin-like fold protein [Kribbella sp. NPDC050124]|uniref:cyclophilin-like fold protein n=1 Tax=Kribbella sp. NPDC050124 TaxID=3364114 RepID=UPI0037B2833A